MLYFYGMGSDDGSRELARSMGADRLSNFDGLEFWKKGNRQDLKAGDIVICWNKKLPVLPGISSLSTYSSPFRNKVVMFATLNNFKCRSLSAYDCSYAKYFTTPPEPLKRSHGAVGAMDLLNPPDKPDYLVVKEDICKEYVYYLFGEKIIGVGVKVKKDGFCLRRELGFECMCGGVLPEGEPITRPDIPHGVHPWIRSANMGWRIEFDRTAAANPVHRKMVRQAMKTTGMTIGCVTLGELAEMPKGQEVTGALTPFGSNLISIGPKSFKDPDGSYVILDVSSPIMGPELVAAYVKAFEACKVQSQVKL